MFSSKKNVLQLVASLKAYDINHIVLSPGSRNAPLVHTFVNHSFFECHTVVDERSAAFFALGLAQQLKHPVALCCTSGTALLNYAPAIAEAYYQRIPLIVISADRSPAWINQMDGQTIPQLNAFGDLVKKSVHLPEIRTDEESWFCQRLIHEAMIDCTKEYCAPVHINVPISEPLFDFAVTEIPQVTPIQYIDSLTTDGFEKLASRWNESKQQLIVLGQMPKDERIKQALEQLSIKTGCVIIGEYLSNTISPFVFNNFDALLGDLEEHERPIYAPDLVITLGGHIVSKRLKHFLRKYKPEQHWHITASGELVDLFQSLTHLVKIDTQSFLDKLYGHLSNSQHKNFRTLWQMRSKATLQPAITTFSATSAISLLMATMKQHVTLHLANSSTVRNVQLFPLDPSIEVYCNRGTNGIEGSLSTANGFATLHDKLTFLVIGDLSFFYDLNAIWNNQLSKNLRILLINNGGGEIFYKLPKLKDSDAISTISAQHTSKAKDWAKAAGLEYSSARNEEELNKNMKRFVSSRVLSEKALLFEIIDDSRKQNEIITN